MKNKTDNNSKQQITKYVVFTIMFIIFGAVMWYLFAPSDSGDKIKDGVNTMLPDPTKDKIIDSRKGAYEQDQLTKNQNSQNNALQEYQRLLSQSEERAVSEKEHNTVSSSADAYRDLNRTLGTFHESPKVDREKEELSKKIDELQDQLAEGGSNRQKMDDQVALMEKSYELAARYLPQTVTKSSVRSGDKVAVTAVSELEEHTVSSLVQPISDSELAKQLSVARNLGFHSAIEQAQMSGRNTIGAMVNNTQTIIEGKSIKLRLFQTILVGDVTIPVNTMITGFCKMAGERLDILVSSIEYGGRLFTVDLIAYDQDGQKGIHIPGSMERTALKDVAATIGGGLGSSINISQQKAGEQLLTDLGRGVIQGTSQYIAKKVSQVKVTLKSGYKLLLLPKE